MSEKNGSGGVHWSTSTDAPTLPAKIDAKAQALSVIGPPVAFFEQPNYQGQALVITRAGGCSDLATCVPSAGNWSNRIRSVKFINAPASILKGGVELTEPPIKSK